MLGKSKNYNSINDSGLLKSYLRNEIVPTAIGGTAIKLEVWEAVTWFKENTVNQKRW